MMGQLPGGQQRLFYSFNLENHVPPQHPLRSIDQCLDLSDLRAHLADFYSPIGRPSIDPELMVRMLVVGYCYGIRSERQLCEEVHLNLAYRWFCRLGLEDEVSNHSTFSKNRHGRFRDSDLFRWLFNEVPRRRMAAGLVKGEGFAVDASIIKADTSRQRGVAGDEVDWRDPALSSRAVREYLEALDEEALAEALPKKFRSLIFNLRRGQQRPKGRTLRRLHTCIQLFLHHLAALKLTCLSAVTPLICATYIQTCRDLRQSRRRKGEPLCQETLLARFRGVEALYALSQYTDDPMPLRGPRPLRKCWLDKQGLLPLANMAAGRR